ncbi:MAG: glycosyltransferase [Desulfuromonas sp.]|nr:MAG: glycosyltransferase [Desulfuromonas sp.]
MSTSLHELPEPMPLMGVKLTPFADYAHAIKTVSFLLASEDKVFSVAVNPEKIYRASHDRSLRELLNRAEICLCDGVGAALAVRVLHRKKIDRITGVALFFELIRAAADNQWRVYLLGASPDVNDAAAKQLQNDHPNLNIVGRQDGYFQEAAAVVDAINASDAQLVFVAMGSPKQEIWIAEHRDQINAQFCMGVGGTFDVVCGKVSWAPEFFRRTGTEWLYRLLMEPKRWRRQLTLPKFVWLVMKYKMGLEKDRGAPLA